MVSLLVRLSRKIGHNQAATELRWMREVSGCKEDLKQMVHRRLKGEPLQYILGTQPFGPLTILTRPPVLIPRTETEQWSLELAERLTSRKSQSHPLKILDLCTGTGCIAMLLSNVLDSHGISVSALGIDVSMAACQLASENIASITLSPTSSLAIRQVDIFHKDFLTIVESAFDSPPLCSSAAGNQALVLDVITANPPYIPMSQWQKLDSDVKQWEDPTALIGDPPLLSSGGEGLTFYKRIRDILSSRHVLAPDGLLVMEVGEGQAEDVAMLFRPILRKVEIWKDLWGKKRAIFLHGAG